MMSSAQRSPREQDSSSNTKNSFNKSDERMIVLQFIGLLSGFAPLGTMRSGAKICCILKQEKNKKAVSTFPLRPVSDGIKVGTPQYVIV